MPSPSQPWESISIDYTWGLPSTKHGNDYVFMVIDRFTKIDILAVYKNNITTEATAKLFFERVWVNFGIPKSVLLYRHIRLLCTFLLSLCSMLDTKVTKSMVFHPHTNG